MVSISSALEVDLTGQVCSDSIGALIYSGIGDQVDFLRGCAMSKGGISIIALPSTAKNGTVSRIVPSLSDGAGVATTRGDVNFIVTEYGIAELQGKSIYQRVMELVQIAHPSFRAELIDKAKQYRYIFSDQLPPSQQDLLFIENYKSTFELRDGGNLEVRPLLPSDEFAYRNFFYSLQDRTIYQRFFYDMKLFSHEVLQREWSKVDYRKNLTLIGLTHTNGHKEIKAIGSYAEGENDCAEIAFVVSEEFQGMGVCSYLLQCLEKIATENGYKKFTAVVMKENSAMLRVLKRRYPNANISEIETNEYRVIMDFSDSLKPPDSSDSDKREIKDELRHRIEHEFSKIFWEDKNKNKMFERLINDVDKRKVDVDQAVRDFVREWSKEKPK
jgi:RimJ/RimL family protein N-acetyltransferase